MDFQIVRDLYYPIIPDEIRKFIPEFSSVFEDNEIYLMVGELTIFVIDNIENESIINEYILFINNALNNGGNETQEVVKNQVFDDVINNRILKETFKNTLSDKALAFFNRYCSDHE